MEVHFIHATKKKKNAPDSKALPFLRPSTTFTYFFQTEYSPSIIIEASVACPRHF